MYNQATIFSRINLFPCGLRWRCLKYLSQAFRGKQVLEIHKNGKPNMLHDLKVKAALGHVPSIFQLYNIGGKDSKEK